MSQGMLLEMPPAPGVPTGRTDSWFTPVDLYQSIPRDYSHTVDVAGHAEAPVSQSIGRWWAIEDDGLAQPWVGERVWCNPPYSDIAPWARKAHEEMRRGCLCVDMLLPANRTEQPWWHEYVEPYRDRSLPMGGIILRCHFLPRRRRFGFPGDPTGETSGSPQFGLVLLRWAGLDAGVQR